MQPSTLHQVRTTWVCSRLKPLDISGGIQYPSFSGSNKINFLWNFHKNVLHIRSVSGNYPDNDIIVNTLTGVEVKTARGLVPVLTGGPAKVYG